MKGFSGRDTGIIIIIIIIIINDSIYPAVSKASRTGIGSDPL